MNDIQNCLINSKWLKEFSPYPLNYNTKELDNYIKLSEAIWILPIIGREWYEELLEQVKTNTLTDAHSTALVEAIWPYLGFAVCYEALPMTWASVTEIGVVKGRSENSESLTLKDLTLVQQHLRNQVEARKDFAIHWINDHIQHFPLICQCKGCDCSCCQDNNAKLNKPNPQAQIWSTNRKCTDLK